MWFVTRYKRRYLSCNPFFKPLDAASIGLHVELSDVDMGVSENRGP